jgi:hypothetical protein
MKGVNAKSRKLYSVKSHRHEARVVGTVVPALAIAQASNRYCVRNRGQRRKSENQQTDVYAHLCALILSLGIVRSELHCVSEALTFDAAVD